MTDFEIAYVAAMERIATALETIATPRTMPEPTAEQLEEQAAQHNVLMQQFAEQGAEMFLSVERRKNEWARIRMERDEFINLNISLDPIPTEK